MLGVIPAFHQNLPAFPKIAGRDRLASDCVLSQPVRSLWDMSGWKKFARRSRDLARRSPVSVAYFSRFPVMSDNFHAPVSGRDFSISVFLSQRLGSNEHET